MITFDEFRSMTDKDKSDHLRNNYPANSRSLMMRRKCRGVGINDADYMTSMHWPDGNGKCPAYRAWTGILDRSYSKKLKSKFHTYENVSMCEEWHRFSIFRKWWIDHHVDGWQIDKDILSANGKIYSPETCIFVPSWLNNFTIDSGASRGKYPIGMHRNKRTGSFVAQCNFMGNGLEYLGCFKNPDDAHNAWLSRKLEIALELKPKMDEIDERIYHGVVMIIKNAR